MRPSVSIVVMSANSGPCIGRCLDSVLTLKPQGIDEIVVLDHGSNDDTWDEVLSRDGVRLVAIPRRSHYAQWLRGLDNTRGDVIAFLDARYCVTSDWLSAGVSAIGRSAVTLGGWPALYGSADIRSVASRLTRRWRRNGNGDIVLAGHSVWIRRSPATHMLVESLRRPKPCAELLYIDRRHRSEISMIPAPSGVTRVQSRTESSHHRRIMWRQLTPRPAAPTPGDASL